MRKSVAVLAIALAAAVVVAPALAQTKPSAEAKAMQRARALAETVKAAFNQKDGAALTALYTSDGLLIGIDGSMATGPAAIAQSYSDLLKTLGDFTFDYELKEAHPFGNGVWAVIVSSFTANFANGPTTRHTHVTEILVPVKGIWKIRMTHASADIPLPSIQR
jgi:uncharacterized protein (TIGR02246 family)